MKFSAECKALKLEPNDIQKKLYLLQCGALPINGPEAREVIAHMTRTGQDYQIRQVMVDAIAALQQQVDTLRTANGRLRTEAERARKEARHAGSNRPAHGPCRTAHPACARNN